jgi:hypothetical protein
MVFTPPGSRISFQPLPSQGMDQFSLLCGGPGMRCRRAGKTGLAKIRRTSVRRRPQRSRSPYSAAESGHACPLPLLYVAWNGTVPFATIADHHRIRSGAAVGSHYQGWLFDGRFSGITRVKGPSETSISPQGVQSAQQGNTYAMTNLGLAFVHSQGVEQDISILSAQNSYPQRFLPVERRSGSNMDRHKDQ